jgi:flagellar M-ring protein FliF
MGAFSGLAKQWNRLGFNQKVTIGTLVLGLLGAMVFLFNQAQDDYDVLYSGMSLPDAAATVAKLKEAKSPYKLADGGTTILVPRQQKGELTLATAGELSSDQTVTLSQIPPIVQGEIQKEWIKKFNTDSIAQVLRSIRGIKNAQVIISQPEQSLFSETPQITSASVMLIVEPGFKLKTEQIKSIKHLVSHAVPGLGEENVAIADNSGNSLEDVTGGSTNSSGGLSEAESRRKNFEEDITRKVVAVLAPVVGKENTVVSVSAQLNFDQSQAKIHRVIPSGGDSNNPTGLAVSQQENIEEYGGEGAKGNTGGAGQPGTSSNTQAPSYQAQIGPDDKNKKQSQYKNTRKTVNYTNSEEDKSVIYAAGSVERMTIAVVLNKVLTAKETDEIKDIVTNAAGIDLARGDSVDVKGFQFTQPVSNKDKELANATKSAFDQAFYLQIATIVGVVVLSLAALFVFLTLLKKPADGQLVTDTPEDELVFLPHGSEAAISGAALSQFLASQSAGGDGSGSMALLMGDKANKKKAAAYILPEIEADPEMEAKRDSIEDIISRDPADAARFLLSYIKDG